MQQGKWSRFSFPRRGCLLACQVQVRKNGETGEPERFEVDKNKLKENVKEKKYYVVGLDEKYEVSSGAALKVEERNGQYYVRFTPKDESTPIEIAVDKIQTIAGSIYADDPNLKEISRIIGDFGVTAAIEIGDNHHMDSNYRYGENNGTALGGSNSIYLPDVHTKGDTSYIGYVKGNVVNSGDSTKRLCINLRENQDLVTSNTADAAGVDQVNGYCFVRTKKADKTYEYYEIQNFAEVVVVEENIADSIRKNPDETANHAEQLGKNKQTEEVTSDINKLTEKNWDLSDRNVSDEKKVLISQGLPILARIRMSSICL